MRSIEQVIPSGSPADLIVLLRNPARPADLGIRMNWMILGVLRTGAAGLAMLAVVFVVLGEWIIAGCLLVGLGLCLLGAWGTERRLRARRDDDDESDARVLPDASIVR